MRWYSEQCRVDPVCSNAHELPWAVQRLEAQVGAQPCPDCLAEATANLEQWWQLPRSSRSEVVPEGPPETALAD
eukprot:10237357-Alexandrium_andersonii.AAC.1